MMNKRYRIPLFVFVINVIFFTRLFGDFPNYGTNPFTFTIPEPVAGNGDSFFVVDLNGDGLLDYSFRSDTKLYAYDHDGTFLWSADIDIPYPDFNSHGAKHGAADVDGDGVVEVVAVNDANRVIIFNGLTGVEENSIPVGVQAEQFVGHVAIADFRGTGDHDILVQTLSTAYKVAPFVYKYYINRSLIAIRMDTRQVLWRVEQDAIPENGIYEGFWGQAHGPFIHADIDLDGKDEVVCGNLIDHDGSVIDLGYPRDWIGVGIDYIDHLDAVSIGDYRPNVFGLEWVVTEENLEKHQTSWNTTMLNIIGILWREETNLFADGLLREPQNVAGGNYDLIRPDCEVWVRSRMGDSSMSQHPWVFHSLGVQFADWETASVLPPGFNTHPDGNNVGIEMIWNIDWKGTRREYIAAKARHVQGNIGIFNAVTGDAEWYTPNDYPAVQAEFVYVADVAGDTREELIIYDQADSRIKVFWNGITNINQPKPKWSDPLYTRIKQNWNYYSPGSYTYPAYPEISNIQVSDVGGSWALISWNTDEPATSQVEFGLTDAYGSESPLDPVLKTSHLLQISGLDEGTLYHFRVKSLNATGGLGISKDQTGIETLIINPPLISDFVIDGDMHPRLSWNPVIGMTGYHVYRSTSPHFEPDRVGGSNRVGTGITDQDPAADGVQWTDTSALIDEPGPHYYYAVSSVLGSDEGDASQESGVFAYHLLENAGSTNFNDIALPLRPLSPGFDSASDLRDLIPNCESVARWLDSQQAYEQYIPAIPSTNFDVDAAYPYFVHVSQETMFFLTGYYVESTYNLVVTPKTDFNGIMLPLSMTGITTASSLRNSIPSCNSVARWDANLQGYVQYFPEIPITDFPVSPGNAYYVNVLENVTWPEAGSAKLAQIDAPAGDAVGMGRVPHAVWSRFDSEDFGIPYQELRFEARILSRPDEVLTETSAGCFIDEDVWIVQCGTFPSAWCEGDVVEISFLDGEGRRVGQTHVELTYAAVDRGEDLMPVGHESNRMPDRFELGNSYPNPFNASTTIRFQIPHSARVRIAVYDMRGHEILTLVNRRFEQGFHEMPWEGENARGIPVGSGVYIIRFESENVLQIRKVCLIR